MMIPLVPVPPLESVALCDVLHNARTSPLACTGGQDAGSNGYIQGAALVYPVTLMTPEEGTAVLAGLQGTIPTIDDLIAGDSAEPFASMGIHQEAMALERMVAGIGNANTANRSKDLEILLALRAFAWLASQVIQTVANAKNGGNFGGAYADLQTKGFQPPAGWLTLIDPDYPVWTVVAGSSSPGDISRVGLARKIANDALLEAEAHPELGLPPITPTTTVTSVFDVGAWEGIPLGARHTLSDVEIGPLQATSIEPSPPGSTFRVWDSPAIKTVQAQGIDGAGDIIGRGLATLASSYLAIMFPLPPAIQQPPKGKLPPGIKVPTPGFHAPDGPGGAHPPVVTTPPAATGPTGETPPTMSASIPWGLLAAGGVVAGGLLVGGLLLNRRKEAAERAENPAGYTLKVRGKTSTRSALGWNNEGGAVEGEPPYVYTLFADAQRAAKNEAGRLKVKGAVLVLRGDGSVAARYESDGEGRVTVRA